MPELANEGTADLSETLGPGGWGGCLMRKPIPKYHGERDSLSQVRLGKPLLLGGKEEQVYGVA